MQNLSLSLQDACASINSTVEEYEKARESAPQIQVPELLAPPSQK